jgi:hypothetical protein
MTTRTRQQGLNQNEPLVRRGVSIQHNKTLVRRG